MTVEELIKALRTTKSRSKRGLLDEAADKLDGLSWRRTEAELPPQNMAVLMTVSGKPRKNIELIGAVQLGSYSEEEGWIVDEWPEWVPEKVEFWLPVPEVMG